MALRKKKPTKPKTATTHDLGVPKPETPEKKPEVVEIALDTLVHHRQEKYCYLSTVTKIDGDTISIYGKTAAGDCWRTTNLKYSSTPVPNTWHRADECPGS